MYLKSVYLTGDVFLTCLQLAFSNEKQEVMGLLIGELERTQDREPSVCARIAHLFIPQRADRKRDRVETSPEQLIEASVEAEALSKKLGKQVTVVGWFHSHPHITVFPSHVDVKTQYTNQLMERGFVGIICSVFNTNEQNRNQIQLTCFQSERKRGDDYVSVNIPFHILPSPSISNESFKTMIKMQETLNTEELNDYETSKAHLETSDFLTQFQNDTALAHAFSRIAQVYSQPLYTALSLKLENDKKEIVRLRREVHKLEMAQKHEESIKRQSGGLRRAEYL